MAIGSVILACLFDYIGIERCDDPETVEPGSGLFISDLPGMTNAVIQAITDPEDETYIVTWKKIQNRAILTFRTHLLSELNKCLQINKMDTIECLACENKELFALALQNLLGSFTMIQALYNWNLSRYSTTDKKAVEDMKDYYFSQFQTELATAVQGIDILNSDCIVKENTCHVAKNGRISIQQSRP